MHSELPFIVDAITTADFHLKLVLGFTFGLCLGLTGVGGGVLLIPLLQFILGMHTVLAVGTASIVASIVKVGAAATHVKQHNVEWQQVGLMFSGAVPLTLLSTQSIIRLNENPQYQVILNHAVQGLVVLLMGASLLLVLAKYHSQAKSPVTSNLPPATKRRTTVLAGMVCGSLLGSTGVGGGVILLPLFNSVIGINIKRAVGSSVVLSLLLSTITAWSYTKNGQGDLTTALPLVIGAFAAIPFTGYLVKHLSDKHIYLLTILIITFSLIITIASEVF